MAVSQTEIESQAVELSEEAFKTFCNDLAGMFGIEIECSRQEICEENIQVLKKRFNKLAAVNTVDSDGILNGSFQLIFDQEGMFTLGGVIIMLPEERILENRKRGTIEDNAGMLDSIGELGNLLVGSWDRVYRENLEGHGHFVQRLPAFIGKPWLKPKEIGLSENDELIFISYEMKIEPFPAFHSGVIFPKSIFETKPEEEHNTEQDKVTEEVPTEASSEPQPVSETIKKISSSSAVLPGEHKAVSSLAICAGDIMETDVVWASSDESIQEALNRMQQHDIGYMLVGKDGAVEGIVSRSDITGAISPYLKPIFAKWRRPLDDASLQIKLRWIITRPVRTISLKTPLMTIMENMTRYGGRSLPVINEQGKIEGIVTVFSIFKSLLKSETNYTLEGTCRSPSCSCASATKAS